MSEINTVEMHWAALKRALLMRGGSRAVIEFLEYATDVARLEHTLTAERQAAEMETRNT